MKQPPGEVIAGPPIQSEADHFFTCPRCGSGIDCRQLGELRAHEDWCTAAGIRCLCRAAIETEMGRTGDCLVAS
jgi:hypothetical protein